MWRFVWFREYKRKIHFKFSHSPEPSTYCVNVNGTDKATNSNVLDRKKCAHFATFVADIAANAWVSCLWIPELGIRATITISQAWRAKYRSFYAINATASCLTYEHSVKHSFPQTIRKQFLANYLFHGESFLSGFPQVPVQLFHYYPTRWSHIWCGGYFRLWTIGNYGRNAHKWWM